MDPEEEQTEIMLGSSGAKGPKHFQKTGVVGGGCEVSKIKFPGSFTPGSSSQPVAQV